MTVTCISVDGLRILEVILSFHVFLSGFGLCFYACQFHAFLYNFIALEKDPSMVLKRNIMSKVSDLKKYYHSWSFL